MQKKQGSLKKLHYLIGHKHNSKALKELALLICKGLNLGGGGGGGEKGGAGIMLHNLGISMEYNNNICNMQIYNLEHTGILYTHMHTHF